MNTYFAKLTDNLTIVILHMYVDIFNCFVGLSRQLCILQAPISMQLYTLYALSSMQLRTLQTP